MDLRKKVEHALQAAFEAEEIRLEEDDGISGYVISRRFRGLEAIDRQGMIYDALHDPSVDLQPEEMREILAIAALTPEEFALVEVG